MLDDGVWRRFWPKVRIAGDDDCWEWQGAIGSKGYGNFGVRAGKTMSAHKIAYMLSKGDVPEGLVVMHACDNRRCCNPAHLSPGTYSDNTQDGVRKGRIRLAGPPGERCGGAKLSNAQAAEVRARYRPGRGNALALAAEFGISPSQVRRIASGQAFREVEPVQ